MEEHERNDTRAAYKGPYVRSIINDKANIFKTSNDWRQKFRISTAEIGVLALLVIEGVFFYGMRRQVMILPTKKLVVALKCFWIAAMV